MGIVEILLTAVGLSMDAFSVALCKGLSMREINRKQAFLIALFFGVAQAVMPVIGWALGTQFQNLITGFDHWLAFVLLAFIGGKMIYDALRGGEDGQCGGAFSIKELFVLAVATSIDALAVGITFAFLQVRILPAAAMIGVTTFLLSVVGCLIGHRFGAKYQSKAQFAGGIALVLIGLKILLEHLGVISF